MGRERGGKGGQLQICTKKCECECECQCQCLCHLLTRSPAEKTVQDERGIGGFHERGHRSVSSKDITCYVCLWMCLFTFQSSAWGLAQGGETRDLILPKLEKERPSWQIAGGKRGLGVFRSCKPPVVL
jgi:hypothetical protein